METGIPKVVHFLINIWSHVWLELQAESQKCIKKKYIFRQELSQQRMIIMGWLTIVIGHCITLYGFNLRKQAAIQ